MLGFFAVSRVTSLSVGFFAVSRQSISSLAVGFFAVSHSSVSLLSVASRPGSPPQHCEEQREDDTHDDGCRKWKVECRVSSPEDVVPRQPPEGHARHHDQADAGHDQADNDEGPAHGLIASARRPGRNIQVRTPRFPRHPIHGWRCSRSTSRIPSAGCRPRPWPGRSRPSTSATS